MTREEQSALFIQSLKALIFRAIKTYDKMQIGDVVAALESEKFSCLYTQMKNLEKERDKDK